MTDTGRDLIDTEDERDLRDINDTGDRNDTGDERLEQYSGDHSILTNYLGWTLYKFILSNQLGTKTTTATPQSLF